MDSIEDLEEPDYEEEPEEEDCLDCQLDIGLGLLLELCPTFSDEVDGLDCHQLENRVIDGKLDFDGLLKEIKQVTGSRFEPYLKQIEELVKTPLSQQGE